MRRLTRIWPRKVRARLAVLYAVLFLIAGSALLALTYGLVASSLPASGTQKSLPRAGLLALCKRPAESGKPSEQLLAKCKAAFNAGARVGSNNQRDQALNTLLYVSLLGLLLTTLVSAGLGWVVSGRALRPVRSITDSARRASELQLGERLALTGPEDELKELADTFDVMLERLDAAFASQRRFVANAAHELRTPLTAMRTAIEVTLAKPNRTPEQLEAMAARVMRSIERAEATVEALLTLAVTEAGRFAAELVDLATAAEDALDAAAAEIAERRLTVESNLDAAYVHGDPVLLERMIANLVDNAVRHNRAGGSVWIHTAQQDGGGLFEIANTGSAISEESIPMLLEPFGRAEQRLNPAEGVGLGLSIAGAISDAHGATLTASSRPGGGLSVSVLVPRGASSA